jgi:hypothetical protein
MTAQMATNSDACSVVGPRPMEDFIAAGAAIEEVRAVLSDSIVATSSQTAQCCNNPSTKQTPKSQHKSSTAPDSGYASQVNTPNSPSQRTLTREETIDFRSRRLFPGKPKKLRIYDKEIDQPTQTRFLDLKVLFGRTLHEFLVKKKVTFTAIQMRLSVLGEDEATAKPWIIIACEKAILKTVKQFFGQIDIKEELRPSTSGWPSFELIVCDRAPRLLTADIDVEVFAHGWDFIEGHSVQSACGMAIQTAVGERTRTTTLGGIIQVHGKTGEVKSYGLTAGHILPSDSVLGASENELEVTSVDEDGLDTDDSQAESYAVQENNLEPPDCPCLDHPFSDSNEDEFEIEIGYGSMSPGNDLASQGREQQPGEHNPSYSTNIGRIVAHSGQSKPSVKEDCNQDWALIELNKAQSAIGNYLIDAHGNSAPHPLQLIQVVEQKALQIDGERPVGVVRTASRPSWGVLSRTLSFLMISPGNAFTETYTLNLGSKPGELRDFPVFSPLCLLTSLIGLKAGDSGSWVFDCQNYKVYGHIVAVDLFGEGIVIPMHAILEDIKREFNATAVWLHGFFGRHSEIGSVPQTPPISDAGYLSMDITPEINPFGPDSFTPKSGDSFIDSAYASLNPSPYGCDRDIYGTPMGANGAMQGPDAASGGNRALQDYQMQLMLREQQNKRRLMMTRQEQDNIGRDQSMPGQPSIKRRSSFVDSTYSSSQVTPSSSTEVTPSSSRVHSSSARVRRPRSSLIRRPRVEHPDRKETADQDRGICDSSSSKSNDFDSTMSSNPFLGCVPAPTSPAQNYGDLPTFGTDVAFTPQSRSDMGNLDLANYDFTFDLLRYFDFDNHSNGS